MDKQLSGLLVNSCEERRLLYAEHPEKHPSGTNAVISLPIGYFRTVQFIGLTQDSNTWGLPQQSVEPGGI